MPIYEFECQDCKAKFENFVLSSRHVQEVSCPKCGSSRVRKQFSPFSCSISTGSGMGGGFSGAMGGGSCGGSGRFS